MKQGNSWWVYIIETNKKQLYTGITTDIERRWQEHCDTAAGASSKGAKFFRSQSPRKIVFKEPHTDRSSASKREAEIKKMTQKQKFKLIIEM